MLINEMIRQGTWLFRWRSYLPLILVPVAFAAFQQSVWFADWFGATLENVWDYCCLALAFVGLGVRIATVGHVPAGTSGRTTRAPRAAVLNTTGMYSLVRHPLYLGNFIVFIAFVLLLKSLLFTVFAATLYFLYYERIMLAEEAFLESVYGDSYRQWAARTPAVVPRLRNWVAPELPFSWRTALLREFHGVLLIASIFFVTELLEAFILEHRSFAQWTATEPVWIVILAVCAVLYLVVLVIKKRTRWLVVAGR